MALRVTGYNASGFDVWDDSGGHGGTVAWAALAWATNPDGTPNRDYFVLACPSAGCGGVSTHPVSGGCDPDAIQELAVRVYTLLKVGGVRNRAEAVAQVRQRIAALDGAGRSRVLD